MAKTSKKKIKKASYTTDNPGLLPIVDGEVILKLTNGCSLKSGSPSSDFVSGEYVRLCAPDDTELFYWASEEWQEDPILVMGAIINAAAGLRAAGLSLEK